MEPLVPAVGLEPTVEKFQTGYEPVSITTSDHTGILFVTEAGIEPDASSLFFATNKRFCIITLPLSLLYL